jgi:hypothetical protein
MDRGVFIEVTRTKFLFLVYIVAAVVKGGKLCPLIIIGGCAIKSKLFVEHFQILNFKYY